MTCPHYIVNRVEGYNEDTRYVWFCVYCKEIFDTIWRVDVV